MRWEMWKGEQRKAGRDQELRCRGCEVMRGAVVETERDAVAFSSLLGRPVLVGHRVSESPCVSARELERIRREEHRACPRVVLPVESAPLAPVISAALAEHTRPLAPQVLSAATRGLPLAERDRLTLRIVRALRDEHIEAKLYPEPVAEE